MLRVLSYNIRRGGIGREQALSETIEACAPDIVVFQEATQPAIIRSLAETARMAHWGATPKWSLGFMSRVPLADARWRRPQVSRHAFLEIVPDGSSFTIFGVHLSAVFSAWTEQRRVFELRALLRSVRLHQRGFHALVGDFNTIAPGELLNPESLPRRVRATMWLSGGRIRWRTIQTV
ncbi:MAG: endonuclease/exonuclease/phosphatase family protein, partial [Vicinamibacterales bacterium]